MGTSGFWKLENGHPCLYCCIVGTRPGRAITSRWRRVARCDIAAGRSGRRASVLAVMALAKESHAR
eukprot:362220-Chlamydomonas_euryale.AAC.9